jgi:hypothetical protein
MPWALGFFTYSSTKEHFISIVGLEGNKSYNCQSFQLRNNGFWVWGGLATAHPSKISISQFWTMSTFHMARALLTETMFNTTFVISAHAMWKMHVVQNYDNEILEGLVVADHPWFLNPLFLSWTLLSLKANMPCKNCTWYKIMIMTFWKDWRSPTPLNPKPIVFLIGRIDGCRSNFLLNLQLKWNVL